jgi:hypothetical protein
MMNPIKWIAGPIIDAASEWNKGRVDLKKKKLDIKSAVAENKARLLRDTSSNNHDWEMANLEDKDKWLRRISFGMFAGPFIWALFDPAGVKDYFDVALASMPEWYIQLFAAMIGGVWGFSALKNSIPAIVGGVKNALNK